jgi:hypothetical protein
VLKCRMLSVLNLLSVIIFSFVMFIFIRLNANILRVLTLSRVKQCCNA